MSAQEAADHSGLHIQTIYGYIRTGKLSARRFGRTYVIEERDLRRLVADPPKPGRPRKAK